MAKLGNKTVAARRVTIDGVTKRVYEWCRDLDLHYETVRQRIVKHDWSPRDAILKPVHDPRPDAHGGNDPYLLRIIAEATGSPILVRRRGGRVSQDVNLKRQASMWSAYKLGRHTVVDIGEFFGGKHHATVIYHVNRFEQLLEDGDGAAHALKDRIDRWVGWALEEADGDQSRYTTGNSAEGHAKTGEYDRARRETKSPAAASDNGASAS